MHKKQKLKKKSFLAFLKKPEWIASLLVVACAFTLSVAFQGPPSGCTPDTCDAPLTQDFVNQRVGIGVDTPTVDFEVACSSGFTSISAGDNQLGCIQTAEQGSGTWLDAQEDCFDSYGGRIPGHEEFFIALNNYTLTDEGDDYEWTSDIEGYDGRAGILYAMRMGTGSFSSSLGNVSQTYRCWLPR